METALLSLKQWQGSPELQSAWAATWREPHMIAALQVMISLGLPKAEPYPAGVDIPITALHREAERIGYFRALEVIDKLKRPRMKKDEPDVDGWGQSSLKSLEAADALRTPQITPEPTK